MKGEKLEFIKFEPGEEVTVRFLDAPTLSHTGGPACIGVVECSICRKEDVNAT